MTNSELIKRLLVLMLVLLLGGCGGDGSGNVSSPPPLEVKKTGSSTGVVSKLDETWVQVAKEGDNFTVSGVTGVQYGANGNFVKKLLSGSSNCGNGTFGDPIAGISKACYVQSASAVTLATINSSTDGLIASEGSSFSLKIPTAVKYGAKSAWIQKLFPDGVSQCTNDYFGSDPLPGTVKACYATSEKLPVAINAIDIVSADSALYSSVPFGQIPANGFYYLNNVFGKGVFVNGVDYFTKMSGRKESFPNSSLIEWSWPDATSGSSFAYAYPETIYGATPWGNPYNSVGPWPQRVDTISRLAAHYDISLGGNKNSFNVLLDMYLTALPDSTDGTRVAEISFFPHFDDPHNMVGIHDFISFGRASVQKLGTQILIRPIDPYNQPRDLLTATIDLKEVMNYLTSLKFISGKEYLRGIEFGAEIQVPNPYNSTPHQGSLNVTSLRYDWQ